MLEHIITIGSLGTDFMVPNYHCILHIAYYHIFQRSRSSIGNANFEAERDKVL